MRHKIKISVAAVIIGCLAFSIAANAQIQEAFKLDLNSKAFVRILDGMYIDSSFVIKNNVKEIYRLSDKEELTRAGLIVQAKPYLILNTNIDSYDSVRYLVPENLSRFQLPIVKNGKAIPWFSIVDIDAFKLEYVPQSKADVRIFPFGYLQLKKE